MTAPNDHNWEELDTMMDQAETAANAIRAEHPGKPTETIQSSMDCPVCKSGVLDYCIAACNGHISASCTTDGCVNFME